MTWTTLTGKHVRTSPSQRATRGADAPNPACRRRKPCSTPPPPPSLYQRIGAAMVAVEADDGKPVLLDIGAQQLADEVAGNDEKHIDAHEAAGGHRGADVIGEDGKDRNRAQPFNIRAKPVPRGRTCATPRMTIAHSDSK